MALSENMEKCKKNKKIFSFRKLRNFRATMGCWKAKGGKDGGVK
ncbi:hypothetical protein CLOLEP_03658 [[Clostridium] leptum DSM 753]|uniref:Uncharacterized protein n=1 Tax=[Clostridium] leptum DSM 753 TaxID=428125 RepID=A7VYI0_9FIRM|nr:hypothetical protein CLOLEP_03658 [[Clostridium] leptum DSM 753]